MTYVAKHMSPVRRRSALVPGPAAQERTSGAHAGSGGVVPSAGGPIPTPRGWATGLLIAGWFVAYVGLLLLGAAQRPARVVEHDGLGRSRPVQALVLGDPVQSVATPSSTPQLPQPRLTVAQVAQPSPAHADGRAHPAKSSSAIQTPGA